ncbi:DJ-1/PfpI family protein [Deinococcus aquiradiocola]|uniref:DJ-1/PfpI family protein n=1 Tax=Deinococcus aquiradiocola TaxID=393059 RepID=A0A917UIE5_9DEIO|nr:DJ-1/PfpI family protein [Deinococcus aquiradiocola]GGJ60626.1 hypothetical protein GCM10008939_00420 [Deinococcus aquiradiocola]
MTLPGTVQPAEPFPPPGPQVGVVVYPGVNELELGVMLGLLLGVTLPGTVGTPDSAALTLARTRGSLLSAGGLVLTPQLAFAAAPSLAAVLVPGGTGAQKAGRDPALQALLTAARSARIPVGACGSGLLVLGEAGLLEGREVGCPGPLTDTVWGYRPAHLEPDAPVSDRQAGTGPLFTGPGGLDALHLTLAVAGEVWPADQLRDAAARVGARSGS